MHKLHVYSYAKIETPNLLLGWSLPRGLTKKRVGRVAAWLFISYSTVKAQRAEQQVEVPVFSVLQPPAGGGSRFSSCLAHEVTWSRQIYTVIPLFIFLLLLVRQRAQNMQK